MFEFPILLIAILISLPSSSLENAPKINTNYDFLHVPTQFQHKFKIDTVSLFSVDSDVSVVLLSCGEIDFLRMAINSFFHFNTYVLREFVIVDYCQLEEIVIWHLLPAQAMKFRNSFFKVHTSQKKIGKMAAIDKVYSSIDTKYVYHISSQWVHIGSYGFIERLKDALTDAQRRNIKVSHVAQTSFQGNSTAMPNALNRTKRGEKYFVLPLSGKYDANVFNFNPHFFNYQKIYKELLNHSYTLTISKLYNCDNEKEKLNDQFNSFDECVSYFVNEHLNKLQFKQMFVNLRGKSIYRHFTAQDKQIAFLNFEGQGIIANRKKTKENKAHKLGSSMSKNLEMITIENNKIQQNNKIQKFIYAFLALALIALFTIYKFCVNPKNCCIDFQNYNHQNIINTHLLVTTVED